MWETPVPIPNTMVKTQAADGTALETVWESRWPPVNTFPGIVHTARHTMGVGNARSQLPNRKEGAAEGGTDNWGEVVTR